MDKVDVFQWPPASPSCCLKKSLQSHHQANSSDYAPAPVARLEGAAFERPTLREAGSFLASNRAAGVVGGGGGPRAAQGLAGDTCLPLQAAEDG